VIAEERVSLCWLRCEVVREEEAHPEDELLEDERLSDPLAAITQMMIPTRKARKRNSIHLLFHTMRLINY
jgi:hypothetical protein